MKIPQLYWGIVIIHFSEINAFSNYANVLNWLLTEINNNSIIGAVIPIKVDKRDLNLYLIFDYM